eukprot:312933_1
MAELEHDSKVTNEDDTKTQTIVSNTSAKQNEEIKNEESYTKVIKSIDNTHDASAPRDTHKELPYRPYKYISTAVTRPQLKANPNGEGILYTDYDDEHKFNYFLCWIGRHGTPYIDGAASISNDLKTVILRDEYEVDNVREDMMINDEGDVESMHTGLMHLFLLTVTVYLVQNKDL